MESNYVLYSKYFGVAFRVDTPCNIDFELNNTSIYYNELLHPLHPSEYSKRKLSITILYSHYADIPTNSQLKISYLELWHILLTKVNYCVNMELKNLYKIVPMQEVEFLMNTKFIKGLYLKGVLLNQDICSIISNFIENNRQYMEQAPCIMYLLKNNIICENSANTVLNIELVQKPLILPYMKFMREVSKVYDGNFTTTLYLWQFNNERYTNYLHQFIYLTSTKNLWFDQLTQYKNKFNYLLHNVVCLYVKHSKETDFPVMDELNINIQRLNLPYVIILNQFYNWFPQIRTLTIEKCKFPSLVIAEIICGNNYAVRNFGSVVFSEIYAPMLLYCFNNKIQINTLTIYKCKVKTLLNIFNFNITPHINLLKIFGTYKDLDKIQTMAKNYNIKLESKKVE